MDDKGRKLFIRTICGTEEGKRSFFDSLTHAFQNNDGFFTYTEEDGVISRYELSFHDDVSEIEHLTSRIGDSSNACTIDGELRLFEPIVFLIEIENDCTVLKQLSFNKMACVLQGIMDDGGNEKKNSTDPSLEHMAEPLIDLKKLSGMQGASQAQIPVISVGGDNANMVSIGELTSLLRQPNPSASCNDLGNIPVIVLDEDNMPRDAALPLKELSGAPKSKKGAVKFGSNELSSHLQGKSRNGAQESSSKEVFDDERAHSSLQIDCLDPSARDSGTENGKQDFRSDASNQSCKGTSESCSDRSCAEGNISDQAMIENIMAKASSPRDKGMPIETESIGKVMARNDEEYAKNLMKKKLDEQSAISKDKEQKPELPENSVKPILVINGYPPDKKNVTTSSPNVDESEASKSLVTLSEVESKQKELSQSRPKVEYCKSSEIDSVVIKITVPENSGIEVVLHKVNDGVDGIKEKVGDGAENLCGSTKDKMVGKEEEAGRVQNEPSVSETLKQTTRSTSPHSKTASQINAEVSFPSSASLSSPRAMQSPSPKNRIMTSINERRQDLEKNTSKGQVKKMVEFFENIRELQE